jgi:voltage-gated potassium channel Kch
MASVGYGDIVPLAREDRLLAIVEALTGQLFLTILVAQLIGVYMAQYQQRD